MTARRLSLPRRKRLEGITRLLRQAGCRDVPALDDLAAAMFPRLGITSLGNLTDDQSVKVERALLRPVASLLRRRLSPREREAAERLVSLCSGDAASTLFRTSAGPGKTRP